MNRWRDCIIQTGVAQLFVACGVVLFGSAASAATDTQIAYFETLSFAQPSTGASNKSGPDAAVSSLQFEAFGRNFILNLQQNPRFAAIAQKLQADTSRQVLQGQLQGDANSWVRLTRVHSRWHGMISSAGELYIVAPAEEVQEFAAPGLTMAKQGTVVFRLSDTYSSLGQSFCGSEMSADTEVPTELDAYDKLVADLKTLQLASQAPGATKRLEVSALGDASFLQRFSSLSDAEDAVLARLNNVDGIFTSQLGISVQVPSINVYTQDPASLSTSTSATTLLDSLGRLRANSPDLKARGVTHLFTGRDLDGTTVGIAYTKSLCDSRYSTSLTESRGRGTWTESLIAAHEIGHNFGAVHDGTGVCASTPQTFLMAPQVNGSSTFSQCSLNSMQQLAQTAPCLIAIPEADMAVSTDLGSIQGYANSPLTWSIAVSNVGNAASTNVHIDVALPAAAQFVSADSGGGTCTMSNGTLDCDLATVAAKSTRMVSITVNSSSVGAWPVSAAVHAASDVDSSNDAGSGTLAIDPSIDLVANLTVSSATAQFSVSNSSDEDSPNVVADISLPSGVTATSATLEGATCTVQSTSVHCTRDLLAAHTTINGTLQLTGSTSVTSSLQLHVSGPDHDPDTSNNTIVRTFSVDVAASTAASKQDSSGGGGGGSFDWLLLSCSGLLTWIRSRRPQSLLQPSR